jgi:hypothetical protein
VSEVQFSTLGTNIVTNVISHPFQTPLTRVDLAGINNRLMDEIYVQYEKGVSVTSSEWIGERECKSI